MKANSTGSSAARAVPNEAVAKPLTELTGRQREKVSSELRRIHKLVSSIEEDGAHKDRCGDKADRVCEVKFKPHR